MDHLRLSELTDTIANALKSALAPSYWVVAEIAELRVAHNGHCYLELVEKSEDNRFVAKVRANIWAYTYRNLGTWFERMAGEPLRSGMKILANAEVQYHPLYGLSLNIRDLDPNYTLGERARQRMETIRQLQDEGVLEMNKELSLPIAPQRIAVISSATAAGYGDFTHQLARNPRAYRFVAQLFPAVMQGDAAVESIISAMHQVYEQQEDFDVLVLIRGGGAQTDLDCFDAYDLAAHLAQFPLPVLTGIGHDRDETVADLVAHTSLKTPTAVAEFLINGLEAVEGQLLLLARRLQQASNLQLEAAAGYLRQVRGQLQLQSQQSLGAQQLHLIKLQNRLQQGTQVQLAQATRQLDQRISKVQIATTQRLSEERSHLSRFEQQLQFQQPAVLLQRGLSYAYVNGKRLLPGTLVKAGDILTSITQDFTINSTVTEVTHGKEKI